jgi:hypothetical protein
MKTVRGIDRAAIGLLLLLCTATIAAGKGYTAAPFIDGEVLRYKVRWGPIRLATMTITQERMPSSAAPRYIVRMSGETKPGLPFLDLVFANRAVLLSDSPTSRDFTFETGRSVKSTIAYRYDGMAGALAIEENDGTSVRTRKIPHEGPLYDGGGIVMLVRCLSGSAIEFAVPTIVDQEIRRTRLTFTNEVKSVHPEALPGPVKVRHFKGDAEWVTQSVAGLTGAFEGWVTDDDAAIPVQASMKILIGSIVLDLESCERPGIFAPVALTDAGAPKETEGGVR